MKTITSIEELEALPEGAIVQDLYGGNYCKTGVVWTAIGYIRPIEFLTQELISAGAITLIYPVIFDAGDVHVATGLASTADPYRELHPSQAESIARAVLGAVGSVEA